MLFINADGEEFEVADQDQEAARKEGLTRAFEFKDQQGEQVVVRENDLNDAMKSGLKPATDIQIGGGEALARGLGSSLSFGLSDEALGALKAAGQKIKGDQASFQELYKRERDLERLKQEEAFQQQAGLYGTGFAGGLIGSPASLIGRGVAKLATKGVQQAIKTAPTVQQIATRGAIEGSVAGLGGGTGLGGSETLPEIAKETAVGAVGGGVLGGALGKVASTLKRPVKELVEEAKENVILKSAGYHTAKPQKILQKAGITPDDFAKDLESRGVFEGVKNTKQVRENIDQLARQDSQKIGNTIKQIDDVTKQNSKPGDFLESIINYRQGVQKKLLGDETAAIDRTEAEALVKKFTQGVDKKFLGGRSPQQLEALKTTNPDEYTRLVSKLETKGFDDLYREKSAISRAIRDLRGQSSEVKASKAEDIQKVLMDTVEKHVARTAPNQQVADDLLSKLAQDRRDMLFSKTAQNVAKESAGREGKNRALSLTDFIAGGSTASALSTTLGPAGIPLGFALGAGAARLGRTKGLGALYKPLKGAEKAIDSGSFERAAQKLTRSGIIGGTASKE